MKQPKIGFNFISWRHFNFDRHRRQRKCLKITSVIATSSDSRSSCHLSRHSQAFPAAHPGKAFDPHPGQWAAPSQRQNASHAELAAESCSFSTNSGLIKLFHHFQSLAQSKSQELQSLFWTTAQLPPPVLWLPSQAFLGLSKSARGVGLNQSALKQLKDTIHAQHLAFCNLIRVRKVTVWATELHTTGPMSNMIAVFVHKRLS